MSRESCPPWCTTNFDHHAHEGLLLEMTGVAVTVNGGIVTQPTLSVWDQTGILAGGPGARDVRLDADEARLLARVLGRIESWEDMTRFAKALTEAAALLDPPAQDGPA
ncbi:MAG: hypothetical protein JWL97_3782 [Gemmatimonadales bacterium]|jgi:hypothetical protein|nr:hypothetical protein [Gemmatimonadales bacterium]